MGCLVAGVSDDRSFLSQKFPVIFWWPEFFLVGASDDRSLFAFLKTPAEKEARPEPGRSFPREKTPVIFPPQKTPVGE